MEESTMLISLFSHKCKEGTDGGHSQFLKSTICLTRYHIVLQCTGH